MSNFTRQISILLLRRTTHLLKTLYSKGLAMLGIVFLIRLTEYFLTKNAVPLKLYACVKAINSDLLLMLAVCGVLLIPLLILNLISEKVQVIITDILFSFFLLIHAALTFYYYTSGNLLGADIYGYNMKEILLTVNASEALDWRVPAGAILVVTLYLLLQWFICNTRILNYKLGVLLAVLSALSLPVYPLVKTLGNEFKNERQYGFYVNKSGYLIEKSVAYYAGASFEKHFLPHSARAINNIAQASGNPDYPFMRPFSDPDVLGPFLEPGLKKINLVFIVVESLGSAYCGPYAYLGSYTPFLDSLITKSLYWPNCLSGGGRTFAALPTIFGSLPYLKSGWLDAGENAPKAGSLFSIMGKNGYHSRFYYGSDASFDNMGTFLQQQGVTIALEESMFDKKRYHTMPGNTDGFSWGFGDTELFENYINIAPKQAAPRIDVLLTVASHSPFKIDNQEKYLANVRGITAHASFAREKKQFLDTYEQQLSCINYADDALRLLFNRLKTMPDYENTLFVITGDHRMPEIPVNTQIDRFHVPLIIYSPALVRSKTFKCVVSHFDITPTLLALLKNREGIPVPAENAFIGGALDTAAGFRINRDYPVRRNKNEMNDYVGKGGYYIYDEQLYRVYQNMDMEKYDNQTVFDSINERYNDFKARNEFVISKKSLLPDIYLQ